MQTPLALEMIAPRATAGGGSASAQIPALRLPAAAWQALLSAFALDAGETSLPGPATVVARAPGETYRIEYAGRIASFSSPQRLTVGSTLQLVAAAARPIVAAPPPAADAAPDGVSISAQALLLEGVLRDPPAPLSLRLDALPPDVSRAASALGEAVFRQQLSAPATAELAFQFAAWPGQNAALVIGREPGQAPHTAPPERVFLARLEMELPELGSVRAMLNLNSRGIDIDLRTATAAAADALSAARDSLVQALAAADLRVGRIEVGHERSG